MYVLKYIRIINIMWSFLQCCLMVEFSGYCYYSPVLLPPPTSHSPLLSSERVTRNELLKQKGSRPNPHIPDSLTWVKTNLHSFIIIKHSSSSCRTTTIHQNTKFRQKYCQKKLWRHGTGGGWQESVWRHDAGKEEERTQLPVQMSQVWKTPPSSVSHDVLIKIILC